MNTEPPKELTQEEKCRLIAYSVGWRDSIISAPIKNYFNSLDACAQFEKTLAPSERYRYCDLLVDGDLDVGESYDLAFACVTATAAQRAEAFGIVKGLWE